jgi:hypothetical protein
MFLNRIFKPSKAYVETQRNRAAVHCLKELKFQPEKIRRALLELNGIRIRKLVNGTSASLVYGTIRGDRKHQPVMDRMAKELDIPVDELFPGKEKSAQAQQST